MPNIVTIDKPKVTFKCFIGCDPGANGGLAMIAGELVAAVRTPDDPMALWNWLIINKRLHGDSVIAALEKVGGYVGEDQPGSRMFNFGESYGMLKGMLVAAGISREDVRPQHWQQSLSIEPRKKSESKTDWKNRLKAKASGLFPRVKVTLAVADALLLAEYMRRKYD